MPRYFYYFVNTDNSLGEAIHGASIYRDLASKIMVISLDILKAYICTKHLVSVTYIELLRIDLVNLTVGKAIYVVSFTT